MLKLNLNYIESNLKNLKKQLSLILADLKNSEKALAEMMGGKWLFGKDHSCQAT